MEWLKTTNALRGLSEPMSEVRIRDLVLTDEHDTVDLEESLVDAAKKLLSLPRGILVALDDGKVKGVLTSIQILAAVAEGSDMASETCGSHIDTDVMEVGQDDIVSEIVQSMNERRPHAVVAVDDRTGSKITKDKKTELRPSVLVSMNGVLKAYLSNQR